MPTPIGNAYANASTQTDIDGGHANAIANTDGNASTEAKLGRRAPTRMLVLTLMLTLTLRHRGHRKGQTLMLSLTIMLGLMLTLILIIAQRLTFIRTLQLLIISLTLTLNDSPRGGL